MKPARGPASSLPKSCASLKNTPRILPVRRSLLALVGTKQTFVGDTAFPSETPLFTPLILAYKGSTPPWLADDRAALRPRRNWCLLTLSSVPRYACASCGALLGFPRQFSLPLACPKPPPRLNRPAESRRQPVGVTLKRVSPALHPPERPSHTHALSLGFIGRGARSRRHRASGSQGSLSNGCCLFR